MKRDGWHLTHVCGGLARELLTVTGGLICPECGESAKVDVRPEQDPDERLTEGRWVRTYKKPDVVTSMAKDER